MPETPDIGAWHLDKRVPLALIFAIVVQTATAVWFIGSLEHRVNSAIADNLRQDSRIGTMESTTNAQAVSTATLTAQLTALRESMAELKSSQAETNRLLRDLITGTGRP